MKKRRYQLLTGIGWPLHELINALPHLSELRNHRGSCSCCHWIPRFHIVRRDLPWTSYITLNQCVTPVIPSSSWDGWVLILVSSLVMRGECVHGHSLVTWRNTSLRNAQLVDYSHSSGPAKIIVGFGRGRIIEFGHNKNYYGFSWTDTLIKKVGRSEN